MHEPDYTSLGNIRYRRKDYEVIHRALELLRDVVRRWNHLAKFHGASEAPYEQEEDHLTSMVHWGEEKLKDVHTLSISVNGMSIESARLQRAALEYSAAMAERRARKESQGMPPAVADSLLSHARAYAAEANKIDLAAHPILEEVLHVLRLGEGATASLPHEWDAFISHASEDKDAIARPLAKALRVNRLRVWFDEAELKLGDSLRQSIDHGLARSRYGIVILSEAFFSKHWPQRELDGLDAREVNGVKVILPIWHGVDHATVARYSPMLAGRLAVSSSRGITAVVDEVLKVLQR